MFDSFFTIFQIQGIIKKLKFFFAYLIYIISKRKLILFPSMIVRLRNYLFYCRARSTDYWHISKNYEKIVTTFITRFKNKEGIFIDIGAHIGRYSILLSKNFKYVFSFEPVLSNYEILQKNIKLNKIKNIYPKKLAISNFNGECYMKYQKNLGESFISNKGNEKIKVIKLDNLLKEFEKLGKVSLIKIDVEGEEVNVIKGSLTLLKKDKPSIIFEAANIKNLNKIKELLEKINYKIVRLDKNNNYYAYSINKLFKK